MQRQKPFASIKASLECGSREAITDMPLGCGRSCYLVQQRGCCLQTTLSTKDMVWDFGNGLVRYR